MKFHKIGAAVAAAAAMALVLSACGSDNAGSTNTGTPQTTEQAATTTGGDTGGSGDSIVDKAKSSGKLTIGVKFDQPGLGLKKDDGSFAGFDIDVARYIAKELGVEESGITFKETPSAQRETALGNHEVDFIVATYSITDKRKAAVSFAGPYFVAHQDLLVKKDSDISSPDKLANKLLCSVTGSTSAQKVKDKYPDVQLKEYGGYSDCVQALKSGAIDAVTTDDVILAGYAAQYPGEFKLVGQPFSDENYGVGLWKGDTKAQSAVNAAIEKMQSDGSWKKSLDANVGPSGYKIPDPPAITEK